MRHLTEIPDALLAEENELAARSIITPEERKLLLDRRQFERTDGAWSETERNARGRK